MTRRRKRIRTTPVQAHADNSPKNGKITPFGENMPSDKADAFKGRQAGGRRKIQDASYEELKMEINALRSELKSLKSAIGPAVEFHDKYGRFIAESVENSIVMEGLYSGQFETAAEAVGDRAIEILRRLSGSSDIETALKAGAALKAIDKRKLD